MGEGQRGRGGAAVAAGSEIFLQHLDDDGQLLQTFTRMLSLQECRLIKIRRGKYTRVITTTHPERLPCAASVDTFFVD